MKAEAVGPGVRFNPIFWMLPAVESYVEGQWFTVLCRYHDSLSRLSERIARKQLGRFQPVLKRRFFVSSHCIPEIYQRFTCLGFLFSIKTELYSTLRSSRRITRFSWLSTAYPCCVHLIT